jgi:segregation and condensation protein A
MTYKVKLDFFEGPLDLLLFLIKKEKIDIYDIPISKVTEQYLAYLDLMKLLDLNIAGEFLVMAATLMHIKSKMLLPPDETEEPEEQGDPREELVRRLLEYKKYKEAAARLKEMRECNKGFFIRKLEGDKEKVFIEGEGYFEASLFDLISAFRKVLKSVPKQKFHEVTKDRFSVSDKIHAIYHMLTNTSRIIFTDLFASASGKDEIIATFLAVLELIKLKEILVVQKDFFSEIEIVRNPGAIQAAGGAKTETGVQSQGA